MTTMKIGHGYDVHALADGDQIVLGGVVIPCQFSLIAHSDGDVVIHALCDAVLGALGRGDIGRIFPDTLDENHNRNSREFLIEVCRLMQLDGYRLGNADITIIAQTPKMAPHIEAMQAVLADDLNASVNCINVKATTTEKLGYIGRSEGIAVHAVVVVESTL